MAGDDHRGVSDLGFAKVLDHSACRLNGVTHHHRHVGGVKPHAAVGTLAVLNAHVASEHARHNARSHHHAVGEDFSLLAQLNVGDACGGHLNARTVVEVGRRVVVGGRRVGAASCAHRDGGHHAQGGVRADGAVVRVHPGGVERERSDADAGRVSRHGGDVEGFRVAKRHACLRIDVAVHVVGAAHVGPSHCGAWLHAQRRRHVLVAARFHLDGVHVARVVKHARAVVLGGVGVVVRGVFVGATWHGRATTVKGMGVEAGPIVDFEHNPLAVLCRGSGTGHPIPCVSILHGGLPHEGVVLGAVGDTCHFPSAPRVSVPIAHGVDHHKGCLVALNEHEAVVSVGQEVHGFVGHCQNGGIRTAMGHDVHITWGHCGPCRKCIPELVFSHHGGRIAHIGVSVTRQINGLRGRVVNLQVLVVGAAFSSLGKEEVVALRPSR